MATGGPLDEPLVFERILLEKVWGGRALESALGIALPPGQKIGETWELSDRTDRNSVVRRGAHQGRTIRDLMTSHGSEILGRARCGPGGTFPLLVKYLDATENLSVQVHPHRGIAHTLPADDRPKTECWYVLAAKPGSGIWHGLRSGVEASRLATEASGPGVAALLSWYRAEPGQFVFVPGGTVHAIGAGVALVEVQENSDTTYRLYDWGRLGLDGKPRETNLEQALRSVRVGGDLRKPRRPYRRGVAHPEDANKRGVCVDADEFAVDLYEITGPLDRETEELAVLYIVIAGRGRIASGGGSKRFEIGAGDTCLVPACLGAHRIEPEGTLRFLHVRTKA